MSHQFVNRNASLSGRADLLAKEWVKYRFGVFEEDGFAGDSLYPDRFVEGKSNVTNTGCQNKTQVRSTLPSLTGHRGDI